MQIKKVLLEFYPEELSLINEQVQKFKRQGIVNFNEDLRPLSMIVDLKKVLKEKEEENVKMLVRKSIIKGFRG